MSSSPDIEEKRKILRCACILEAQMQGGTESFDPAWKAKAVDISLNGVGLQSKKEFEVGAIVKLQVFNSNFETLLPLEAEIVHCTQLLDGSWLIGAKFLTALKEEELKMLLE